MEDLNRNAPPRLPKVMIPVDARREIIDYFTQLDAQTPDNSYKWCYIHNILSSLLHESDPIEGIAENADQNRMSFQKDIHPIYTEALEMLYAVRHRLEAEYRKKDE